MDATGGLIRLKQGSLDCSGRTLVMGALNVTPDSFSDGGKFYEPLLAVQQGIKMVRDGADIIDIGGESTRPGSDPVSADEEIRRVVPVIEALSRETDVPISIDTCKAEVADRALEAGASIVNDISALRFDPAVADVAVRHGAAVVLMHMAGTPKTMQENPHYDDLMGEIGAFLQERIDFVLGKGLVKEKIVVDPGIGFGKTVEHNLQILKQLKKLEGLGRPILIGTSRKSFIGHILKAGIDEREEGTAATVAVGIVNGAGIVRVHDVAKMTPVVRMTDAIVRV